ncbi:DUF7282 domain-containing protein [Halosimplex salinum]|uniref:DUF7282 domain-containing protein n=1 Tax=Halosimplex salinum TaxID=1710538 RepID=UPI000F46810B|nr:BGTF surface domain-containing protein [Halosimplex salinum]
MLDRRAVSTYGVLVVLAVAVVGATGAPAVALGGTDSPTAGSAASGDATACSIAGPAGSGSVGAAATASGHSRESYPDAPHMDVARGDIAAIETGILRGRTGTVRIESVGGEFNVSLTFANNDGRKPATLYVNTYLAGNESAVDDLAYTAGDGDRVSVDGRSSVSGAPMPTGAYDVTVEKKSGTERERLTIDDPSVDDFTLLRAPGDRFENLSTERAVNEGLRSGVVSDPPRISGGDRAAALGDTMVYRLNASGLYGLLAAQGGGSVGENFLAIEGDDATRALDLGITRGDGCPPSVDVPASVGDGTMHVIPDSTNETLYLATDLRRAALTGSSGWDSATARASVSVFDRTHLSDSNVTRSLEYEILDREIDYDPAGEAIRRQAASGQRIGGETTLAPGSRLTLDVTAYDGDYETQAVTEVDDDGTFDTTVNLSEAPDDARLTLSVAEVDGSITLLTTGNAPETAVWFQEYESPSTEEATTIDGVRVALDDPGFVAAYAVPPDEQVTHADVIGRSAYLQSGVHTTAVDLDRPLTDSRTVVLAVHRDDDGDGQFDYPADDSPVRVDDEAVYTAGRVLLSGDGSSPPMDPEYLRVSLLPADEIEGTPVPTATPTDEPTATPTPSPTAEPVGTTELPPPTLRGEETPTPDQSGTDAPNGTAVSPTVNGTVGPNGTAAANVTDGDGPTEGFGPGFGPGAVLVAVAVLVGAALVRRS